MERDERYEVSSDGRIVIGQPVTLTGKERKAMIEKMFSINGWKYTILQEITSAHYHIKLENENLGITRTFHLYHGNVRKEDPERNREEKKIQLGTENDPRTHMDDALILGFYVYENKDSLSDTIIVAWPIEEEKNYPANPSLRVNMRTDIQVAKNTGYYVDKVTGKNLVVFRPEFIYHYIENYKNLQYSNVLKVTIKTKGLLLVAMSFFMAFQVLVRVGLLSMSIANREVLLKDLYSTRTILIQILSGRFFLQLQKMDR